MEPPGNTRCVAATAPELDPSLPDGSFSSLLFPDRMPAHVGDDSEIIVDDARWRGTVPAAVEIVRRAIAATRLWALRQGDEPMTPETVVLSCDRVVKRLNARHRDRNKPTNVLTFEPSGPWGGGEIILALETVRREARATGRPVANHLAHLVVHGALHLAGYDHHQAGEARRMEMEEARILALIGVPNPWKPRT